MNLIIRTATTNDNFTIADIIKDSMGYDNSPALIKENLERILLLNTDLILIAEYDRQPVGFIHAENYDCLYDSPLKDLMSFAVKQKYQNKGIGTALIKSVEKWAAETGRKGIRILSDMNFEKGHRFYSSLGYAVNKQQLNIIKYF